MLVSQASRMQVFHTFTGSTSSATFGPFEVQGAGEISIMAIHNPPTAAGTVQWQQLFLRGGNDTVFSNATNLIGFSGVTATTSVTTSSFNLAVYSSATPVAPITLLTVKNPRFSHLFIQAQAPSATSNIPVFVVVADTPPQAPNTNAERNVIANVSSDAGADNSF